VGRPEKKIFLSPQMWAGWKKKYFPPRKCGQAGKKNIFLPTNVGSPEKKIFFSPQMWAARKFFFQAAVICFASGGDDNTSKPFPRNS
jgi:hypothetical protein